jgi:tryptophanyl-tRNA synthetase
MPTVNAIWSHQVAIIMGDYLYSRSVTELTRMGEIEYIAVLAEASNAMSVGEMRQLASHDALSFDEDAYYRLIHCKTASLITAACELGALTGNPAFRPQLARFGHELGMAFQIVDDMLDYTADEAVTGKPSGLDLREHKVTLPLIAVLPTLSPRERSRIEDFFAEPKPLLTEAKRIMGLDGQAKMSKSLGNTIGLLDSAEEIWQKLRPAKTDPARVTRRDPGTPEVCNIYHLHRHFSPPETVAVVAENCRGAKWGCLDCKRVLADNIIATLKPIRERALDLQEHPERVQEILPQLSFVVAAGAVVIAVTFVSLNEW